jgi:hypothetical protein
LRLAKPDASQSQIEQWAAEYESSATKSAPLTKRAEGRTETRIMDTNKKESIFKNFILGPEPVEKSADLKEFAYSGDGKPQREVAPESPATRIHSFNGQSEDGTRSGAYVADPFLAPNPNGMLTPAPVTPYSVTDAGTATPHLLNFIPEGEPEQFRPAGFEAPKPGNRPQGPASVRLGA